MLASGSIDWFTVSLLPANIISTFGQEINTDEWVGLCHRHHFAILHMMHAALGPMTYKGNANIA